MSGFFAASGSSENNTDEVKADIPPIGFVPFAPKPLIKSDFSLLLGPVGVGILSLNPGFVNQPIDPFQFMEACTAKAVLSMVMGGTMGAAMGFLFGSYSSIAPPMSLPGVPEPPKIPIKWQLRESWMSTARKSRRWGTNFLLVSLVFSQVECVIEKGRAKHDIANGVSAGCITGASLAARQGPAAMCFGCVGFASFSFMMEKIMGF